jgi:hypothetical protein
MAEFDFIAAGPLISAREAERLNKAIGTGQVEEKRTARQAVQGVTERAGPVDLAEI